MQYSPPHYTFKLRHKDTILHLEYVGPRKQFEEELLERT
jgi:hypothetical protein